MNNGNVKHVKDSFDFRIALNIREKGRGDDQPGRLKAVQGIGWWLEERNIAQVQINSKELDITVE